MNALEARAQALETQKARWMKLHIDTRKAIESSVSCDCYMSCPVYGLYVEAQNRTKTKVVNTDNWQTPPSPKTEML